jgi:endogenous inhibitor of DNA gyrase (YacG/DUF329 family)
VQLLPLDEQWVTLKEMAAHISPGEKRLACLTCGSLTIRERKTMYLPYFCQKCAFKEDLPTIARKRYV